MKNQEVKEVWVPAKYIKDDGAVLDFTGKYEVSDHGKVRSLNYKRTGKIKVLNHGVYKDTSGAIIHQVLLRKDNKKYFLYVHRLVLSSFDPKGFRPGDVVNHKVERTPDSCIDDLSNLEWLTQKDNNSTIHAKTMNSKAKINHPSLSKRVRVVDLTTNTVTEYPSRREADRALGLPEATAASAINQHKGFYKKLNLYFECIE